MLSYDGSRSSVSSTSSWFSYSSDLSVFIDDKDLLRQKSAKQTRFSAQQLAERSAAKHYPKFCSTVTGKCAKLHWACHVGWCLCKYQYQPLTPLHMLPNTPIPFPGIKRINITMARSDINFTYKSKYDLEGRKQNIMRKNYSTEDDHMMEAKNDVKLEKVKEEATDNDANEQNIFKLQEDEFEDEESDFQRLETTV